MIHQDYIARIRYSNALPPPPVPPKLLDIPHHGLEFYTSSSYASRLARQQPMNIETDGELGMPLDLVGMPGVFDGDESSIQAPAKAPPVHPHDRLLLRPLSTLGKPKTGASDVSFLRRTEYISSGVSKPKDSIFLKAGGNSANARRPERRKVASPEPGKGTPAWMKRCIEKSFSAAAAQLADRSRVKHPSKRNLKLVDAQPLLPDLDAFPDSGAYVAVKFQTNPVTSTDVYDSRMLSGLLLPIERNQTQEAAFEAAMKLHERDPVNNPRPNNMMDYNFFMPENVETGEKFRQCFDIDNPNNKDESLYTLDDGSFRFPHLRAYETAKETEMTHSTKYDEEVILAYNETDKVVYYYPVMQRSVIRNQRTKNIARNIGISTGEEEVQHSDELHVKVVDPDEEVRMEIALYKKQPVGDVRYPEEE